MRLFLNYSEILKEPLKKNKCIKHYGCEIVITESIFFLNLENPPVGMYKKKIIYHNISPFCFLAWIFFIFFFFQSPLAPQNIQSAKSLSTSSKLPPPPSRYCYPSPFPLRYGGSLGSIRGSCQRGEKGRTGGGGGGRKEEGGGVGKFSCDDNRGKRRKVGGWMDGWVGGSQFSTRADEPLRYRQMEKRRGTGRKKEIKKQKERKKNRKQKERKKERKEKRKERDKI